MHQNSIEAYKGLDISKGQKAVLGAIKALKEATIQDVSGLLDKPVNQISGRFTELKNAYLIKEIGTNYKGSQPYAVYALVKSSAERQTLIEKAAKKLKTELKALECDMCYKVSEYARKAINKRINQIKKQLKNVRS